MFRQDKKGQSILEYAILIGVVLSALLIMQVFVKRGFQGGLKDSADKMGEQFSAGGTAIEQYRSMEGTQTITEESGTDATIQQFGIGAQAVGVIDKGAISVTQRSGGKQKAQTKTQTDAATQEKVRWSEYQTDAVTDFTDPF